MSSQISVFDVSCASQRSPYTLLRCNYFLMNRRNCWSWQKKLQNNSQTATAKRQWTTATTTAKKGDLNEQRNKNLGKIYHDNQKYFHNSLAWHIGNGQWAFICFRLQLMLNSVISSVAALYPPRTRSSLFKYSLFIYF